MRRVLVVPLLCALLLVIVAFNVPPNGMQTLLFMLAAFLVGVWWVMRWISRWEVFNMNKSYRGDKRDRKPTKKRWPGSGPHVGRDDRN